MAPVFISPEDKKEKTADIKAESVFIDQLLEILFRQIEESK